MSSESHIELRIGYRNRPSYVALLRGRCPEFGFVRVFNPFFVRREFLPDGSREEIHLLPNASATYEVEEVRNKERIRWFAATVADDPEIHRISLLGAEMVAKKRISITRVIHEYPEMPRIELEEE